MDFHDQLPFVNFDKRHDCPPIGRGALIYAVATVRSVSHASTADFL